jgi:hypothetical protein
MRTEKRVSHSDVPFAERKPSTHTDGTPILQTPGDQRNQNRVAEVIANAWTCELHNFGFLAPIDYYATKDGRLVSVIEIKCRSHATTKYETVFLNVRKWLSLGLAQIGLGVPAVFAVDFTDELRFIRWSDVDATRHSIAGCETYMRSRSDIEPIIEVPVRNMALILRKEKHDE